MVDHARLREAINRTPMGGQNTHGSGHDGWTTIRIDDYRVIVAAAESTLPRTKMVEVSVWGVFIEFVDHPPILAATRDSEHDAEEARRRHWPDGSVVRLAGKAEVPSP